MIQISFCKTALLGTLIILFAVGTAAAESTSSPLDVQPTGRFEVSGDFQFWEVQEAVPALFTEEDRSFLQGKELMLGFGTKPSMESPVGLGHWAFGSFMHPTPSFSVVLDGRGVGLTPLAIDSGDQNHIMTSQAQPLWDGRGVGLIDLAAYATGPASSIEVGF